jgi:regulator of sigma E protease
MTSLLALIVVLGVLIFVHELGHFLAARAMGVAVIRFSFGLGPKTPLAVKWGETEYCISWIPFGGYVKMAGHDDEGPSGKLEGGEDPEVAAVPKERHLESKSRPARALIFSAGVIMNLLFAFVVYTFMAARYGVVRDTTVTILEVRADQLPLGAGPVSSLRPGDRIVTINDDTVTGWEAIQRAIMLSEETPVRIGVAGRAEPVLVDVPLSRQEQRAAVLRALVPAVEPVIGVVVPGEQADSAGLRRGDRVLTAGGDTMVAWQRLVAAIEAHPEQPLPLVIQRAGAIETVTVRPRAERVTRNDSTLRVGKIGTQPFYELERFGFGGSIREGVRRTGAAAGEIVFVLKGLVLGRISPRDIGGPILIGQLSGQAARLGLEQFLGFMALFSVNLAILNLLPIPVLDGGHLMFLLIEGVRRKPLSVEARQRWMTVGLVLVLMLMVLAVYNDVMRLFQ